MMKIVACATLLVAAFLAVEADKISERAGHENHMIPRLGHFNQKPFIDLYKTYAAAFVYPKHMKDRARDDYRNYMPSGDECMIFFKKFRINQYKLASLDEFVVLDACLGYLYMNEEQQKIDIESSDQVKALLTQLQGDEHLKAMFEGTKVNEMSEDAQECVADLMLNTIVAKHQYPDVVCNNHFLQVFIQFAECQSGVVSEQQRAEDSYLSTIYSLLRDSVGLCVEHEIGHINEAFRHIYVKHGMTRLANKITGHFKSLSKQAGQRMWPKPVTTLLAAVQNTTKEVNQREVHQLIRGVIVNDEQLKQRLLNHMAYYADKHIQPKAGNSAAAQDPSGLSRYNHLIDNLCRFFRSSDQESIYDFATPIIRLVQLLAHEDLFGISQREFVRKILTNDAMETAPIYLGVQACNILTFTEGALAMPKTNTKQHYQVAFKSDTSAMVLWPDAGYY